MPLMARLAVAFYVLLAAVGATINAVRDRPLVPLAGEPDRLLPATAAALVAAAGIIFGSAVASRRFEWAKRLEATFRQALGPLERREIRVIALASGLGEEIFFRGALQPALGDLLRSDVIGLLLATLVFALLHTAPGRGLIAWTIFAFVVGLLLGGLFSWSGSVIPPVLLHVVVNDRNLARIARPLRVAAEDA